MGTAFRPSAFRAAAMALLLVASGYAQRPLTKADSGWIPLFNGSDYSGLYIRLGSTLQDPAKQTAFKIENGSLRVYPSGGIGAIATREVYDRYQVRVEYRFGGGQSNPNAGLLYHIDPGDWKAGDAFGTRNAAVPYLSGTYVKSVEWQMYRGDAGAFLGIMNVWVTADTKGDANHTWQAGGTPYTAYPSGGLAERRIYRSVNAAPIDTDWVRFDGRILGADSVSHGVNGTVVMRGRNLRHNAKLALTSKDDADQVPMDRGHIGLQAEGAEVWYRNWELRPLDAAGVPIIAGCRDPKSPDFNPLANRDGGTCRPATVLRPLPKSSVAAAREAAFSLLGERGRRHPPSYRPRNRETASSHSQGRSGPGNR